MKATPAARLDCSLGLAAWRARVLCQASGSSLATSCVKAAGPSARRARGRQRRAPHANRYGCRVRCQTRVSPLLVRLALP